MALQSIASASALPIALAVIPSLPRPYLARLVARMIDRLDEMDPDSDLEDGDEDRCTAGEDGGLFLSSAPLSSDYEDSEPDEGPAFMLDQRDVRFEVQIPPTRRKAA